VPTPAIQADILANAHQSRDRGHIEILAYPEHTEGGYERYRCPDGPMRRWSRLRLNNLSSVIGKIDHTFNPSNVVTGRYFFGDSTQSFPLALTASAASYPLQYHHSNPGAVGFHFVCADHRLEQGE